MDKYAQALVGNNSDSLKHVNSPQPEALELNLLHRRPRPAGMQDSNLATLLCEYNSRGDYPAFASGISP